jgi:hypothetical protein
VVQYGRWEKGLFFDYRSYVGEWFFTSKTWAFQVTLQEIKGPAKKCTCDTNGLAGEFFAVGGLYYLSIRVW